MLPHRDDALVIDSTVRPGPGDEGGLAAILRRAGVARSPGEVRELVEGAASAPEGFDPDAWMSLVSPAPTAELRTYLRNLLDDTRRRRGIGSGPGFAERLQWLRKELRRRRLSGFLVPRGDEHQSEQVAPSSERLAWLCGFTGSAGMAVVLAERAALFVDGRYTVQAKLQADPALWEFRHAIEQPAAEWIAENLPAGGRLGFDPWLHPSEQVNGYRAACRKARGRLVRVADNPIDRIWSDRPPPPLAPVVAHDLGFAGKPSTDKRRLAAESLGRNRLDAAFLTAPDSIAWLLNIRGGDVPWSPLPLAFALLHADGRVELVCDPRKLGPDLVAHFGDGVAVVPPEHLGQVLDRLGAQGGMVGIEPQGTPEWVVDRLRRAGAETVAGEDPCALPKATKNPAELAGTRAAHRRDGAALARFLAWLDRKAPSGAVSERSAAQRLDAFRRENRLYRGGSFPTISAAGSNAAIVHYRPAAATDRRLLPGSLYLVDSGGQYLDGTTDVTRTVAIGTPSGEMRDRFTRVLKGHIALALARFPKGTTGPQLDALARQSLWQAGLDYDHGTGHGVGAYSCVHEGPQRISKLPNRTPLAPGMLLSNEPGYYRAGAYGIRIENLVAVTEVLAPDGAEHRLLGFETLTLAPIDLRLVDTRLLNPGERGWLDAYHARVRMLLGGLVDADTAAWLTDATRPLPG
jgi:Xaa-Pro aminopeptidase